MRIIALVKRLDHVCCRYRLAALRPYLERVGHSLRLLPWPRTFLSRMLLRSQLQGADVLIMQRKMPPAWQLDQFRSLVPRLVFDFDDAIFCRDSFYSGGHHCPKRASRFRGVVKSVDAIVAGNSFLQEQASLWVDPARVFHIPTCVDLDRYRPAVHQANQTPICLAWIGSSSTLRGLSQIRPLLETVGNQMPGLRLKIICDRFIDLDYLQIDRCCWSETTETEELAASQIGFSWLPDDLWSRGKCGLKVLQYLSAGLPVIANPVGMHLQMVLPGQTGFLVETAEEFVRAVKTLASDAGLRQRMGEAGRELVRKTFHVRRGGSCWVELLARLEAGIPVVAQSG